VKDLNGSEKKKKPPHNGLASEASENIKREASSGKSDHAKKKRRMGGPMANT